MGVPAAGNKGLVEWEHEDASAMLIQYLFEKNEDKIATMDLD